jgi:hypothetical protein
VLLASYRTNVVFDVRGVRASLIGESNGALGLLNGGEILCDRWERLLLVFGGFGLDNSMEIPENSGKMGTPAEIGVAIFEDVLVRLTV